MEKRYKIGMFTALLLLLALAVTGCSKKEETQEVAPEDRILMVNDTLYYGTTETGPMGDADSVEGKILSTTQGGEVPTENGQSNFGGVGNPYTYDDGNGGIMVFIDEEYFWFYKENAEEAGGTDKEKEDSFESGTEEADNGENPKETESGTDTEDVLDLSMSPVSFTYSSGAGAWGTFLNLEADGSFTGGYNDSDMGDSGEGYPHGKHYYCEFQGKFGDFQKIDENTISMTLKELTFEPEAGSEEIRDEILYVGAEPLGLDGGTEFIFYLPETSLSGLSEEFLSWWPERYEWDGESERSLNCYGILNQETGAGFFSNAACESCGAVAVSPQTGVCEVCGYTRQ